VRKAAPTAFDLTFLDAYGHLWMAVLRQAMDDATMHTGSREAAVARSAARQWLRSQEDGVGTVQWICDTLNIRMDILLREFQRRTNRGGIIRRRRVVANTYHKRPS
jgi:hypothetical protein